MSDLHICKRAVHASKVINEAYDYARPSMFSRALRVDVGSLSVILVSGTAALNKDGNIDCIGDFRGQCRKMWENVTALLQAEGATWNDVIRTTYYLRDIARDYTAFNEERTAFYTDLGLNPLPASTGVQAVLCFQELLIEMEAIALLPNS